MSRRGSGLVFVFPSRKADRLKLIYWHGSGLMMAKGLDEHTFTSPDIRDGLMAQKRCSPGSTGDEFALLRRECQRQSSRCVTVRPD